jgi:steroid delta-isomerase-like uncharacterized protein
MTTQVTNVQMMTCLVTELLEAWNAHDVQRVAQFYAPDFEGVDVAQASPQRGPEAIRRSITNYFQAFPDLRFMADVIIIQDEQVALAWTAHGTHRGKLMNIPPTGRPIRVQGVSLLTILDGKIKKASYIWDVAGLLRSIGLLPEL